MIIAISFCSGYSYEMGGGHVICFLFTLCFVYTYSLPFSTKKGVVSGAEDSTGEAVAEPAQRIIISPSNHILSSIHAGIILKILCLLVCVCVFACLYVCGLVRT